MPMAVSITSINTAGQNIMVTFNLKASGSYVTAVGGDVINFATATQDPAFLGLVAAVISSQLLQLDVWSQGGNLLNQYIANKTGVNPATGGKVIVGSTTFGTEL